MLLSLLAPPAASGHAQHTRTHGTRVAQLPNALLLAEIAAARHWGTAPCSGHVAIQWADMQPSDPGAGGEALIGQCVVRFNTDVYPDREAMLIDWPQFCTVVVHEFGHLILGPSYFAAVNPSDPVHSPDPHNVMFATVTPLDVPPECQRWPAPWLRPVAMYPGPSRSP